MRPFRVFVTAAAAAAGVLVGIAVTAYAAGIMAGTAAEWQLRRYVERWRRGAASPQTRPPR